MDFNEVPVTSERKSKKKKNKKAGNKRVSEAENGESAGVEKKSEEKIMENGESSAAFPPTFSVSEIKNKQRRHLMFMKLKQEKRKVKQTYRSDRESPAGVQGFTLMHIALLFQSTFLL